MPERALTSSFLTSEHTRRHCREEVYYPDPVIDRLSQGDWEAAGRNGGAERAHDKVRRMLEAPDIPLLESDKMKELEPLMASDAAAAGIDKLPEWRLF